MDEISKKNDNSKSGAKDALRGEYKNKFGLKKIIILSLVIIFGILFFSGTFSFGSGSNAVIGVSFIVALAGGFLSLISPCSAAMLPVFFAYSFKEKKELVKMTFIFFLGLATLFIPLGFSASLVSKLFINNQIIFFNSAGAIFIVLGIIVFFGKSWQWLPRSLREKARVSGEGKKNIGTVYIMGVLFSFASGTCSAPIIGAILTLASTSSNSIMAVLMLLTYAFGLVLPLFIIAWFFDRYNFAGSKIIQGKSWDIALGGKTFYLHTTNIITSVLFIGVGIVFIVSKGTNAFLHNFEQLGLTDYYFDLNEKVLLRANEIPNWPFLLAAAAIIVWLMLRYSKKKNNT